MYLMYKAFTGALALVLTILVLHWLLPEVAAALVEVVLKTLVLLSAALDAIAQGVAAQ